MANTPFGASFSPRLSFIVLAVACTTSPLLRAENEDLLSLGQSLFDAYAPAEIKNEFTFPTREQWDAFAARLEKTRTSGSLAELAAYEPEARAALIALRALPEYQDYADWLATRLDEIVIAKEATQTPTAPVPPAKPVEPAEPVKPVEPAKPVDPETPVLPPVVPPTTPASDDIPLYDLWVTRVRTHPRPARADEFLPILKKAFSDEGMPPALAWIAETESTFNPTAKSPAGARGLFQLMPVTAKAQGLSLLPFDERTHPEKSARAAATLLRRLHGMFDSWPLAHAAYNAGEGRVRRALKNQNATTFAQIADVLPSETRLYVPKVLATLAVRESFDPTTLAAPR